MPSTSAASEPRTFAAIYYDGRTAQRHAVTVRLRAGALDVVNDDGEIADQWLYGEVELSDQGSGGSRVVKRGTEARLVFADPLAFAALKAMAPALLSQKQRTLRNMGLSIAVTVAVILIGYFSIPALSSAVVAVIPLDSEARIGDAVAEDMAEIFTAKEDQAVCGESPGREVLDELVQRLAAHSSGPFAYEVEVLNAPLVNAMALPGGRIFIFRGLLDKAESADEVAGVIAHEMAHINHRHGLQSMVRSFGVSLLADMMFGGGTMGSVSNIAMMMSYSREAEQQADVDAIATLRGANISTAGIARFFERLQESENGSDYGLPTFLSTHPASDARADMARTGRADGWTLDAQKWMALKAICGPPED